MNSDLLGLLLGPAHLGFPVVLFLQGHPAWREAKGGEAADPTPLRGRDSRAGCRTDTPPPTPAGYQLLMWPCLALSREAQSPGCYPAGLTFSPGLPSGPGLPWDGEEWTEA